jgi:hypothetical protein
LTTQFSRTSASENVRRSDDGYFSCKNPAQQQAEFLNIVDLAKASIARERDGASFFGNGNAEGVAQLGQTESGAVARPDVD